MRARALVVMLAAGLALVAEAAAKPLPSVTARFETNRDEVPVGAVADVVLWVTAASAAPDVIAEILPSADVDVVSGPLQSRLALAAGDTAAIPLRVRFVGRGEYTLGARITNRAGPRTEVSGAVLYVTTSERTAGLSREDHFTTRLARASTMADLAVLGVVAPVTAPVPQADELSVSGTVHGTVRWTDPEGNTHPVRGAAVQIFDGAAGGTLLTTTVTGAEGKYTAGVTASTNQVSVMVYTLSWNGSAFGTVVGISPDGQPDMTYALVIGPVTLTGDLTLDLTAPRTQRGTPGHPDTTPNTASLRAFSVFDAIRTSWYQAGELLGTSMPAAKVMFPAPCPGSPSASCFSRASQQLYILRDDAYDWDVLGHEFQHFVNYTFSQGGRSIVNSPGGPHSGGSAIGENGRNRDEGMRLAWSEGLTTAIPLLLQQAPLPTVSPFPTNLLNLADRKYEDTEDATITQDPETPSPNDGFASENSILGFFWDAWDTSQDTSTVGGASVTDGLGGLGPKALWDLITVTLPCNPCDRFDRFWNALTTLVPLSNPGIFTVSSLLAMNTMAPQTTAPASGSAFGGGVPPKFEWVANGDPHADHRNDTFMLVFSRDHFDRHVYWLPVPTKGAASYTPTEAQWNQLQQGGTATDTYEWFVTAYSSAAGADNPQVPPGTPWYSNLRSFTVRSIHIKITWVPLGADVDLHLAPPTGQDIAYYNRTPGWGVLDRDCISDCTEENISLISVPATGTYRAFAQYFSDHGKGPAHVEAQVFQSGQVVLATSFTLEDTGDTAGIFSVFVTATGHGAPSVRIEPSTRRGPYDGPPLPPKRGR